MSNRNEAPVLLPVIRSSLGLRNALFDELDALREGKSNPQRAIAVSKLAAQIIGAARNNFSAEQALENQALRAA